jgi:hypothetical protein
MAARGRTNKTAAPKKAASKPAAAKPTAKAKATGKTKTAANVILDVYSSAKDKLTGGGSKKGSGGISGSHKSAKQLLKKAYERRAKHQIRTGNLGQARRTLRKKQTVV